MSTTRRGFLGNLFGTLGALGLIATTEPKRLIEVLSTPEPLTPDGSTLPSENIKPPIGFNRQDGQLFVRNDGQLFMQINNPTTWVELGEK